MHRTQRIKRPEAAFSFFSTAPTSVFSATKRENGFTIIELLFVLIVATILLSVAIPRIRIVTKERGVREAARIVASKFANASQQAQANGSAGVLIRRNRNFRDGSRWFAATEIGSLRAIPNFVGDQRFEKGVLPALGVWRTSPTEVEIPVPIEFEENSPVNPGDWISFNHTHAQYEITKTALAMSDINDIPVLKLELDITGDSHPQLPPILVDAPYVIHRQPKLKRSSVEQLPNQYVIDLRFSGFSSFDPVFEKVVQVGDAVFENYDLVFIFGPRGNVEKVYFYEVDPNNQRTGLVTSRHVSESIHFLIAQTADSFDRSPLADELSLWVNVNSESGAATVSYIDAQRPTLVGNTNDSHINDARGITHIEARH